MNSLENQNMINDLHISNGSKSVSPEYPSYIERRDQDEFNQEDEWSAVSESGAPVGKSAGKKTYSGTAVNMAQRLNQLLTFVALVAAAAMIVPDIVPISIGSADIYHSESSGHESEEKIYYEQSEESIMFSLPVYAINGEELTVVVEDGFIKEKASLILGNFNDPDPDNGDPDGYRELKNTVESGTGDQIIRLEEYLMVSAGENPQYHYVSVEANGLKPGMTYRVTAVCGGKTLTVDRVTTRSENNKDGN